jgi:tetratricopeptide (TPR) repeat protein
VAGEKIPARLDARAALWRSALASRRVVVVLDNAHDVAQVRPLLPAAVRSAVLVTSRDRLDGLCVREGALRIPLEPLDASSTTRLLRSRLGACSGDEDTLHRVAEFCAGHPLAVCLLAVRVSSEGLAHVASVLDDPVRGLDLLHDWDDTSALSTVFSWSVSALRPSARSLFFLIGLQRSDFIDTGSAAALLGRSPRITGRLLAELHHANLIERSETGWYTIHDLVRRYATHIGARAISVGDQHEARRRLLTHLHARASLAAGTIEPLDSCRRYGEPDGIGKITGFAGQAAAAEWLDRQLPGILSLIAECTATDLAPTVVGLAATLSRYLMITGRHSTAIMLHRRAISAARRCHDRTAAGHAWCDLGAALIQSGDWTGSVKALTSALKTARGNADTAAQGRAAGNLGVAYQRMGEHNRAMGMQRTALRLAKTSGDRAASGRARNSLGTTFGLLGRYDDARAEFEAALGIAQSTGDITTQTRALNNLGELHVRQHRRAEALGCLEQALALLPGSGDRSVEGDICCTIGRTHAAAGRAKDATVYYLTALEIAAAHDLPMLRIEALNGLGEAASLSGDHSSAAERYRTAAADADQIGYKMGRAIALQGLADNGMPVPAATIR